ncbi:RDD family protein [Nocardioides sp. URHA0020]|uniref:RDD family protein n=1 Tax=Nocardioides sp. URHA0020 TaxID=1380392 RepID=UPI000687C19A|nr:RDD family protein [Nocardioides sp. URHA0020]
MSEPDLSHIPREARAFQGRPAGLVSRMIANAVDAAVVGALLLAGYLGINGLLFFLDPRSFHFHEPVPLLTLTSAFVVAGLYLGVSWALVARTYGCHVMGLRVVGRRGHRLRVLVALARGAFCVLFPIGLFWCVVNPRSRSIQDIVLRTSVVYDWMPRAHEPTVVSVSD